MANRVGVEDTRLESKAKNTKNIQGQGQPFRGRTLSKPRTGMLEAKDQGQRCISVLQKKRSSKIFSGNLKKTGFQKFFSGDLQKRNQNKVVQIFFSGNLQNFNNSKNSAVLEPRTGQFSRTWGFEAKAKNLTVEAKIKNFKMCPRELHF